ncbi:hypothetical protein [Aliivibrio finisterrensis]|nr:hypothetical protein [Aliivibrio finisterrensis]
MTKPLIPQSNVLLDSIRDVLNGGLRPFQRKVQCKPSALYL